MRSFDADRASMSMEHYFQTRSPFQEDKLVAKGWHGPRVRDDARMHATYQSDARALIP